VYDEDSLPTTEKVRQNRVMDSVLVKAKWAHDHIDDLDWACSEFFDQKPCPCIIRTEHNPKAPQQVIYRFRIKQSGNGLFVLCPGLRENFFPAILRKSLILLGFLDSCFALSY